MILIIFISIFNAFWQELLFRGILQKSLINSFGIFFGILITSSIFSLLHILVDDLSFLDIILGIVIFSMVGLLYHFTDSLIFAITLHSTGNFILQSFEMNSLILPEKIYRLFVYGVLLFIMLIILVIKSTRHKNKEVNSNQASKNKIIEIASKDES